MIFWKVGTNPQKYIDNFFDFLGDYQKGYSFKINGTKVCDQTSFEIVNLMSLATFSQNLVAWESFGFIVKLNQFNFVKIIEPNLPLETIKKIAMFMLPMPSCDERVASYRNSIIIKLALLSDSSTINKLNLKKYKVNNSNIIDDIKHECGKFENWIMSIDKEYVNTVVNDLVKRSKYDK